MENYSPKQINLKYQSLSTTTTYAQALEKPTELNYSRSPCLHPLFLPMSGTFDFTESVFGSLADCHRPLTWVAFWFCDRLSWFQLPHSGETLGMDQETADHLFFDNCQSFVCLLAQRRIQLTVSAFIVNFLCDLCSFDVQAFCVKRLRVIRLM